jgi:hypothetical protein
MSDQTTVIRALQSASRILSDYLEPGPRDAEETINRLLVVLDSQELATAMNRMDDAGNRART